MAILVDFAIVYDVPEIHNTLPALRTEAARRGYEAFIAVRSPEWLERNNLLDIPSNFFQLSRAQRDRVRTEGVSPTFDGQVAAAVFFIIGWGNDNTVSQYVRSEWRGVADRFKIRGRQVDRNGRTFRNQRRCMRGAAAAVESLPLSDRINALAGCEPVDAPGSFAAIMRTYSLFGRDPLGGQRRAESTKIAANICDWESTDTWRCPAGSANEIVNYPIEQMTPQHVWQTIIWVITNSEELFTQYALTKQWDYQRRVPLETVKIWLSKQSAFRALVQHAIRCNVTFPDEVFDYLHEYLVGDKRDLEVPMPWHDPEVAEQVNALADFLQQPVRVTTEAEMQTRFGRSARELDI